MLLHDIGNSAVKSAQVKKHKINKIESLPINDQKSIKIVEKIILNAPGTQKILICNSNQDLNSNALNNLHPDIQIVHSAKSFKQLKNGYINYKQLGADRWLNMIYAWDMLNTACCVIDCGTCITYDQIDTTGQHLGGFILPGQNLTQKSLQDLLNIKPVLTNNTELGKDTDSAVANGSALSFSNPIQGLIRYFKTSTNSKYHSNILITGGGAKSVARHIKDDIIFIDNMVLNGLLLMCKSYAGAGL